MRTAWFTVKREAELFNQQISFVDPEFFDVFALPVVAGDPKAALADPLSVILTESVVERHFGDEDAVGKPMTILPATEVKVGAVLADLPETTHLAMEIIAPKNSPAILERLGRSVNTDDNFRAANETFYVRAQAGQLQSVGQAISKVATDTANQRLEAAAEGPATSVDVRVTPIAAIHTGPTLRGDAKPTADATKLTLFSAVALALLIVSGFNYMTMSLARAVSRAREVGLRKALGADHASVARFYLGESAAFTFFSVLAGFALAELALPWFAQAVGRDLDMNTLHSPVFLLYAFLSATVLAVLVGAYPAFYLARQSAVDALQGKVSGGRAVSTFSGGLVVIQFGAATALLALMLVDR
ncbi:MAG: FtsX-like permease family protein, partial [Myxococcota bacterium]